MYVQNIIKRTLLSIFVICVLGYTGYKLIPLLSGPEIIITSTDYTTNAGIVTINGVAKRAKELKVFDKVVDMNQDGMFTEYIIKHKPYTTIIISATDKWGKMKEMKLVVNK